MTPTTPPPRAMETAREFAQRVFLSWNVIAISEALEARDAETRRAAVADCILMNCIYCREGVELDGDVHVWWVKDERHGTTCKSAGIRRASASPASTAKEE